MYYWYNNVFLITPDKVNCTVYSILILIQETNFQIKIHRYNRKHFFSKLNILNEGILANNNDIFYDSFDLNKVINYYQSVLPTKKYVKFTIRVWHVIHNLINILIKIKLDLHVLLVFNLWFIEINEHYYTMEIIQTSIQYLMSCCIYKTI